MEYGLRFHGNTAARVTFITHVIYSVAFTFFTYIVDFQIELSDPFVK